LPITVGRLTISGGGLQAEIIDLGSAATGSRVGKGA